LTKFYCMKMPLLPHRLKLPGLVLFITSGVIGLAQIVSGYELPALQCSVFSLVNSEFLGKTSYFSWTQTNITATLLGVLFIVGGMMAGLSEEKEEDEYTQTLRLSAMTWAVWINYGILLLAFLLVYGLDFLSVMVYNMFTILLSFNLRYYYLLYLAKHPKNHDE
jgi:hypothetical protein